MHSKPLATEAINGSAWLDNESIHLLTTTITLVARLLRVIERTPSHLQQMKRPQRLSLLIFIG